MLKKVAPTAVVVMMVAYCCWTEPERKPLDDGGKGKKAYEIKTDMLKPTIPSSPVRDPFGLAKPAMPPAGQPVKPTVGTASKPVAKIPEGSKPTATQSSKSGSGEFVLNATCIRGERRVALINGEFYTEGERLKLPNGNPTSVMVARVLVNKVILRNEQTPVELTFPDREPQQPGNRATGSGSSPLAQPDRSRQSVTAKAGGEPGKQQRPHSNRP